MKLNGQMPRIVLIGTGSAVFGMKTLGDLPAVGTERLNASTVAFRDPDENALELTNHAFNQAIEARRREHEGKLPFSVEKNVDLTSRPVWDELSRRIHRKPRPRRHIPHLASVRTASAHRARSRDSFPRFEGDGGFMAGGIDFCISTGKNLTRFSYKTKTCRERKKL